MTAATEKRLRRLASEWHTGQWSEMYKFASTGRCDDWGKLWGECVGIAEVDELREYAAAREA